MAKKHSKTHLTAARIQAFLDDALSREERVEIQDHATFCGHCQAEMETWQLLYSELGELPQLSPSPNFAGSSQISEKRTEVTGRYAPSGVASPRSWET